MSCLCRERIWKVAEPLSDAKGQKDAAAPQALLYSVGISWDVIYSSRVSNVFLRIPGVSPTFRSNTKAFSTGFFMLLITIRTFLKEDGGDHFLSCQCNLGSQSQVWDCCHWFCIPHRRQLMSQPRRTDGIEANNV